MIRVITTLIFCFLSMSHVAWAETSSTKEPYKVGVILGLTGPAATWSKNSLRGIELGLDEIHRAGGVDGRKIKLIVEDSKTEASNSVTAYNKLVRIDGVRIVIGDIWAHLTNSILPLSERDQVVLIAPTVSDDSPDLKGKYFFTMGHRVDSVREAVGNFFKKNPSVRRVGILCFDNSWGHAYSKMWQQVAMENGAEVVDEMCSFGFGNEHRTTISRFRAKKVDAVIAAEWTDQIIRAMREQKLDAQLLGTSNVTEALFVRNSDNDIMEGTFFTDWRPDENFRRQFLEKYGEEPILEAQNSYEIARAVAKALAVSDVAIAEALRKVRYQGVDGLVDFSEGTFANKSVGGLFQIKQGKIVSVE